MEAVVFLTFPGSGNLMVVLTLVEAGVITHAHIQIDKSHESSFCWNAKKIEVCTKEWIIDLQANK